MLTDLTIILFAGFNEVALPKGAQLGDIETDGFEVSLQVKSGNETEVTYRQFYVAFNQTPTDYNQGILRLLKTIQFSDGTTSAMVYEVYPYKPAEE
ncbi:hypothetical protein [Spirosoma panaciterrae]|uniref:hypothetical protein n=1 Tax=Spirosoma panaciterrae TaxID=496058 RepID=UPI0003771319|nr:hypothetical protein [Spirosoma panaciterrae]